MSKPDCFTLKERNINYCEQNGEMWQTSKREKNERKKERRKKR